MVLVSSSMVYVGRVERSTTPGYAVDWRCGSGGSRLPPVIDFGYVSILFFQNGHGLLCIIMRTNKCSLQNVSNDTEKCEEKFPLI